MRSGLLTNFAQSLEEMFCMTALPEKLVASWALVKLIVSLVDVSRDKRLDFLLPNRFQRDVASEAPGKKVIPIQL